VIRIMFLVTPYCFKLVRRATPPKILPIIHIARWQILMPVNYGSILTRIEDLYIILEIMLAYYAETSGLGEFAFLPTVC